GQLIQSLQLAGPRRRARVQHSPVLPEQHLGLVQGGEVADQVAPELGQASGGGDLQVRVDNETLRVDRTRACELPGARGGQERSGGTSSASKLAPSTGSVWPSSISGSTRRQRSADPSQTAASSWPL